MDSFPDEEEGSFLRKPGTHRPQLSAPTCAEPQTLTKDLHQPKELQEKWLHPKQEQHVLWHFNLLYCIPETPEPGAAVAVNASSLAAAGGAERAGAPQETCLAIC